MKAAAVMVLTAALGLALAGCGAQEPPASGPAEERDGAPGLESAPRPDVSQAPPDADGDAPGLEPAPHPDVSQAPPDADGDASGLEPDPFPAYAQMQELVAVEGTVDILRGDDMTTRFGQTLLTTTGGREYELEYTDTFNAYWGPTGTEFAKITSVVAQPKYFYQNERFLFLFLEAYGGMDYDATYVMCLNYGTRHFTSFSQELPWESLRGCELLDGLLYVYTASSSMSGKDYSFRVMVFDPMDEDFLCDAGMIHNEVYDFGLDCESFAAGEDGVRVRFRNSEQVETIAIF